MLKLILLSLYSLISYSEVAPSLKQFSCPANWHSIGQSCGSTGAVKIVSVCIEFWPPPPGYHTDLNAYIQIITTTYVEEIVIGTCYNNMFWTYDPMNYGVNLPGGEDGDIGISITFPTQPGSYQGNFQLVANGEHVNCWQFNYMM